jgi:LacI family transcriptional regulator, repressor for deo operon, udp, cdd, tsx, nupC, and nupG
MKKEKRVSIRDVAKEANVSVQTVSRVVNNKDGISEATRERIQGIIESMGYEPDVIARSLVAGKSYTIACIAQSLTDHALASIIEAMRKSAEAAGYIVLAGQAETATEARNLIDLFRRRRVDGLVIIDPGMDSRFEYVKELVASGFPIVYIGTTPEDDSVSYVNCDDFQSCRDATRYLIGLGHRRIATITGPLTEQNARMRLAGYKAALEEDDISYDEGLVATGSWLAKNGYDSLRAIAARGRPFTGVVVQSDPFAVGAMAALRELGMRVPEKVSLVGMDDHPWAAYLDPPLTTMRQDLNQIGGEAIRLALDRMTKKEWRAEGVCVGTSLVERSSCAPLQASWPTRTKADGINETL